MRYSLSSSSVSTDWRLAMALSAVESPLYKLTETQGRSDNGIFE